MLSRPIPDDPQLANLWKLRRKFNEVMDDLFEVERFSHVMNIHDMEEFKYFDGHGNLTAVCKKQFWIGINDQIKAFEYHKMDL